MQKNGHSAWYIIIYYIIRSLILMHKKHFTVAGGHDRVSFNIFIYSLVLWSSLSQTWDQASGSWAYHKVYKVKPNLKNNDSCQIKIVE